MLCCQDQPSLTTAGEGFLYFALISAERKKEGGSIFDTFELFDLTETLEESLLLSGILLIKLEIESVSSFRSSSILIGFFLKIHFLNYYLFFLKNCNPYESWHGLPKGFHQASKENYLFQKLPPPTHFP